MGSMDPKLLQQIEEDRQLDGTFGEHYRSTPEVELDLGIPTLAEEAERATKETAAPPAPVAPKRTPADDLAASMASLRLKRYDHYRLNARQLLLSFVPPSRLVRNLRQWRSDSLARRRDIRDGYREVRALRREVEQ